MSGSRCWRLCLRYGLRVVARRLIPLIAIALCALTISTPAKGAPGDLSGQSCISKGGADGCAVMPEPSMLEFANGVAVAPDGTDVYVGAGAGIAHFRRASDGSLTYANCVDTGSSPFDRCPPASAPPDANGALSANAINLAISPDGKHVYAVSWVDALLWWARDPVSGNLTWGGCRDASDESATNGRCGTATTIAGGNFPAGSMDFSQGIAVTPDGQTIYIADQSGGLLQAQRNASTGAATPKACFDTTGGAAAGCTTTAADIPMALSGIDVASNSRDVYVRSISPGGLTHFTRTAGGVTSFASCVAYVSPSASCATAAPSPVFAYSGSLGVAGAVLFTHGGNNGNVMGTIPPSGTTARFGRNADGTLAFEGCATTESSPGPCAIHPAQTSAGSIGKLLVAPDASSVYLPHRGNVERALTRLGGSLSFLSCLSDTGVGGCAPAPLPAAFARPIGQMALSPDGRQIYQAGEDILNIYAVAGSAEAPAGGSPSPPGPPKATAPKIKSVKRDKKGRYRVKVTVFEAGALSARFTGRLKPKGKVRTLGKVATKLATKPGAYTLKLTPLAAARKLEVRAKLVVRIAPAGFLPAQRIKPVRLK